MLQNIEVWKIVTSVALLFLATLFLNLYRVLVAKPEKVRASMRLQGVQGPPGRFLLGNILDIYNIHSKSKAEREDKKTTMNEQMRHGYEATIFPFTKKWREEYGGLFTFALGTIQCLFVGDPEMVKEIATCTSLDLGKPLLKHRASTMLLGKGLINSNGESWAHQRKIIAPEFYTEKIKGMVHLINESALSVIQTWKKEIDANGGQAEIIVDEYMRNFTGDVISKFCFGSHYLKGQSIFLKLRALLTVLSKNSLYSDWIPGIRWLPTKNNREAWALEKGIRYLVQQVVYDRKKQARHDEKDLLQIIIEGAESNKSSSLKEKEQFIVDNCKNIYLAGYETTALAATWCMMLLAVNQEWQARVRAELLEVCDGKIPSLEMVNKMKQLTMVIQEALRLYPPGFIVAREALKDIKLGEYHIPQGVNVWTMIPSLQTDPKAWGPDSYKFNPSRFANGIASASKYPHYYMPFGIGPRICPGLNLAMVELKIIMCLMLTNFSFTLSENYVRSPSFHMSIEPGHQVPLLMKCL